MTILPRATLQNGRLCVVGGVRRLAATTARMYVDVVFQSPPL